MEYRVRITCGEEDIPINHYVEEVVTNVVVGILRTLKGIDLSKENIISIEKIKD